ncbi:MAG: TetR/AcrR family transcriptional regulator [Pseudomonadota bacterium]
MASTSMTVPKRKQEERTREMRSRLIEATIECLNKYGYAGTTISMIVDEAGVSRGAHLYHFESKAALLVATTEALIKRVYLSIGTTVPEPEPGSDYLETLIQALWAKIFLSPYGKATTEILIAAQSDKELSMKLRKLSPRSREMFIIAADHFLESRPDSDISPADILFLNQWLMRGMLLERPIGSGNTKVLRSFLAKWTKMIRQFVIPREGVKGPPPKPEWWEED